MYRVYVRASKGGKTECSTVLKRIGRQYKKKKLKLREAMVRARYSIEGRGQVEGGGGGGVR